MWRSIILMNFSWFTLNFQVKICGLWNIFPSQILPSFNLAPIWLAKSIWIRSECRVSGLGTWCLTSRLFWLSGGIIFNEHSNGSYNVQAVSINTRPPIFNKEIIVLLKNGVFPLKIARIYRQLLKELNTDFESL